MSTIVIPPPIRCDFLEFGKVLKRIFLTMIIFTGVMLAVDSAYSQFVLPLRAEPICGTRSTPLVNAGAATTSEAPGAVPMRTL